MAVSDENAWHFCYVLPSLHPTPLEEIEIVVPNSLQMGWCESPPFFCASTETARDIIMSLLDADLPTHPMESTMLQAFDSLQSQATSHPHATMLEVYVDDFVGATNRITLQHLTQVSRSMLHGIHSIFPPPQVTKHCGADPISEKKLEKGEGTWSHQKEILGWNFDGKAFTIQLPADKCIIICSMIRKLLKKNKCSLNRFQKLAGKLQHASMGIPGGKALFTPLDMAMTGDPEYILLTPSLKQCLEDWRFFVRYMQNHPTNVLQLVCAPPDYINYTDSCGLGSGGVCSSGNCRLQPCVWQFEWPDHIKTDLCTASNPQGRITMNDLELAGAVMGFLVLEWKQIPLRHRHVATFCDNTSAVSWAYKLRNSTSLIAGRLLRLLGLRIHVSHASSIIPHHICGEDNVMADTVSRAFKKGKFFTASQNIVAYFNSTFPLPQSQSWIEFQLPTELTSPVIACLLGKQQPLASLLKLPLPGKSTGAIGQGMQRCATSTPSSARTLSPHSNVTSSQGPLLQGSGKVCSALESRSVLEASRPLSQPSQRPLSWLDNQVPCTGGNKNTSSLSKGK